MHGTISYIAPDGPLSGSCITPGDSLLSINGNKINDILDYEYYSYDDDITLVFNTPDGRVKVVRVYKQEGEDPGLEFDEPLMDKQRSCMNKCIFCFIDQLPGGMRETLYYKDDDVRLSFLQGNYVTLTNLSDEDIDRIIRLRISPVNVSVHTLNPRLRQFMLGRQFDGNCANPTEHIRKLARAGIALNCQIVCCPGINDGQELRETIEGLISLGSALNSVSVVPVGLTKHREGLYKLKPFDAVSAQRTIKLTGHYGRLCKRKYGTRIFYCADELYILAGYEIPKSAYYEDYPQLENGVGMMRLFISQFLSEAAKNRDTGAVRHIAECSVVTGALAAPYLTKLLQVISEEYDTISNCRIYPVKNEFFGESVTVAGLVTGSDIIDQLQGKPLGNKLLIPQNMLRSGEDVFLDDITVQQVSDILGVPAVTVKTDGMDFYKEITDND